MKALFFDLDDTLAESKQPLEPEMCQLLKTMSNTRTIVIISGCSPKQFEQQVLKYLIPLIAPHRFVFAATSGTQVLLPAGEELRHVYHEVLNDQEKAQIIVAYHHTALNIGLKFWLDPNYKVYGPVCEDRESQMTFSLCGQNASIETKKAFQAKYDNVRREMAFDMSKRLYGYGLEARAGGTTSIDVTKQDRDKAFGIRKVLEICEYLKLEESIFVGDKLEFGGNDYPATTTGIRCIPVTCVADTKELLKQWIQEDQKE